MVRSFETAGGRLDLRACDAFYTGLRARGRGLGTLRPQARFSPVVPVRRRRAARAGGSQRVSWGKTGPARPILGPSLVFRAQPPRIRPNQPLPLVDRHWRASF